MKLTVIITIEAENELREIAEYLNEQQPGLGSRFMVEYFLTLDYLQLYPQARPLKKNKFREILIGRFHVLMIYEIIGNQVRIRKVIHAARRESSRLQK